MTVGTPAGAHPLRRYAKGLFSLVDSPGTPLVAAAAAVLLRLPALGTPLRSDESGFLLVARSWDPRPDSLLGPYFVDRPPLLIAVMKLSNWIGGPHFLRVVPPIACGLLVLAAAQVARLIANDLAARWTAVAVAALAVNPLIDAEAVKGELLALLAGLLAGSGRTEAEPGRRTCLRRRRPGDESPDRSALPPQLLRLGGAAAVGAAVPTALTVGWALAVDVRLSTLAYAVDGFRSDASLVIAEQSAAAPLGRALILVLVAIGASLVFVIGGFLVHLTGEWRDDQETTAATLAVLLVDVAGLVAGGSYWRDYLFPLVPATALCAAMLARRSSKRGRAMRTVIVAAAASSALVVVGWIGWVAASEADRSATDLRGGEAIALAAEPGDTLVVFGGHAEIQLASGLPSPYPYLWSLPMRTLDPEYAELRALLASTRAPSWLMASVPFDAWGNPAGPALQRAVDRHYVRHGTGCSDLPVYLRRRLTRPPVAATDCD